MKAANILYDENENSAFFQYYSQLFGDGLFFEIVERKGGYDGYGTANDPFPDCGPETASQIERYPREIAASEKHLTDDFPRFGLCASLRACVQGLLSR